MDDPNDLGWKEVAPTAYQANTMGYSRKFILGTQDGSSRRDLVLKRAAMPRPIFLRPNTYEMNGVEVPPPSTWASLRLNPGAAEFDVEVEIVDIADIVDNVVRPTQLVRKKLPFLNVSSKPKHLFPANRISFYFHDTLANRINSI